METININGGQPCVGIYLDGLSVYRTWISDRNESTKERRKYAADISVAAGRFRDVCVMAFDPCCLYEADPLPVSKG